MTTGTDFLGELTSAKRAPSEWSRIAMAHLLNGEMPDWLRPDQWVPVQATITDPKSGQSHTLTYYVTPDFVSVGTNDDFALAVLTPSDAQMLADSLNAILPTRRMALAIYRGADHKLPLTDVKGPPTNLPLSDIQSAKAMVAARTIDRSRYSSVPSGQLFDGHRKYVVLGPDLDGSRVAIYGGGGGNVDGVFWQPYSTIHDAAYADDTHGTRLVYQTAQLDGHAVDIRALFSDPVLSQLVSDQGMFAPQFPNAGVAVTPTNATYSVDTGGGDSSETAPAEQYSSTAVADGGNAPFSGVFSPNPYADGFSLKKAAGYGLVGGLLGWWLGR